ncbi:DEAD/DEAH box helicase [Labrys wisconsinensis]|uniref:ATP-dependent RNA helicase DeaD n=1 Tax=Labrys wisconsinensis TaxID=425677 RepID=A0ABU0JBW7_9HYPH|nr:DEAD/DEAH box helicase [Labrys wisconsinensis]MDQ0471771.1 ATP-dependent RNA helicase DeaD [Labrys wisconsinensis]
MTFLPSLHPALSQALAERNYSEATPVQAAVLEAAPERDLLVSAQTGSGKTVAYGLAIGSDLLGEAQAFAPAGAPQALVVAPTRELALQVQRELAWLYAAAGGRVVACVGGMDPRREQRALAEGAHVVVGTPGRLRDHLERGALKVGALEAVVLDEADEMLDMGFREDLEFILEATPPERRTLLFSATLPKGIVALARRYQREAQRIAVAGDERGHADIEYRALRVHGQEVERAVVNVLRFVEAPGAIVFCNTREAVRHLQATLVERGFSAVALSGELGQHERNQALQALRDGRARVCVATDVAARGIDLPNLALVIHADLPHDAEALQHRSGRTGRAGRKGVSVVLASPSKRRRAERLLAEAGIRVDWTAAPGAEEIRRLDQERLLVDPLLTEAASEDDLATARALLARRPAEEIAAALVRVYRAQHPLPEEIGDPGAGREVGEGRGPRPREHREDEPARGEGGSVWFRLAVGRRNNADPRWLLPMLCRRGGVERQDIGAIRIFERETKFEVMAGAAERFVEAVRAGGEGKEGRIEPAVAPPGPRDHKGPRGPHKGVPGSPKRFGKPTRKA